MKWPDWRNRTLDWWHYFVVRQIWVQILLSAVAVALLGEIKLQLYVNSAFRLTLGPVGLGAALLFFPNLPAVWTGAAAGTAVILLRTLTGLAAGGFLADPQSCLAALPGIFNSFWPAGVYYVSYSALFSLLRARKLAGMRHLSLFIVLTATDILSNVLELALRPDPITLLAFEAFVVAGMGRSSVLAGLYLTMKHQVEEWQYEHERVEYRRLLLLVTGLQAEVFFLSKSSAEIEHIMVRAHTLRQRLKGDPELAPLALDVAKDVHEVKKDYQRILSGLQRLTRVQGLAREMSLSEVVDLVLEANRSYAAWLGKTVEFASDVQDDFTSENYMVWVSVLNNLVVNAVEACAKRGKVTVSASSNGNQYAVRVTDTGIGIPRADWELIFSPGYSTKSDPETGDFSTGLGLVHAMGLVESLGGTIQVESSGPGFTVFRIECPLESQTQRRSVSSRTQPMSE